ncbi:MAG: hypothetical protein ACFFEE_11310 [Candidatus Thorarchaeota archaeon]
MCENAEEISGFIKSLSNFGRHLTEDVLNEIQLSNLRFILLSRADLIFAISIDDDKIEEHSDTLSNIIDLFGDIYDTFSFGIEDEIDVIVYQDFPRFLVDQEILHLNCGKYVECEGCPNREKSLPLGDMTKELDSQHNV